MQQEGCIFQAKDNNIIIVMYNTGESTTCWHVLVLSIHSSQPTEQNVEAAALTNQTNQTNKSYVY